MLQFFHDSGLKIANTQNSPKRFLSPEEGMSNKTSVIYMADTYQASITEAVVVNQTSILLNKTDEFFDEGTARVVSNGINYKITYTSKTVNSLEGCSNVAAAFKIGDVVKPWKIYKTNGNFKVTPRGADLTYVQIALGSQVNQFNFPGSTCILPINSYDMVQDSALPIYISAGCFAGSEQEFTNWQISTNPVYTRDLNDSSAISSSEIATTITAYGDLFRRDNFQVSSLRLLPNKRSISANEPGFKFGSYRWRDSSNVNSQIVIPTTWDPDISSIGTNGFVSGIGHANDLVPIDIENDENSIYLRIKNGFYFVGPTRYFLPANPQIQFINASQTSIYVTPPPNFGLPVFVGTWVLDNNKFYRTQIEYRYQASQFFNTNANAPTYQYILDKQTNLLTLNTQLPSQVYFLGLLSGKSSDYFDLPTYPVDSILSIYVDRGLGNAKVYTNSYSFNRDLGTVTLTAPANGLETSIPLAYPGEPVYALCNPAYAVMYDSGTGQDRLLDSIDLNPAFSGISSGYVYLQHRRQEPTSLTLASDKPIIVIPDTYSSIIDLIAYGPIYFDGDYSLLTVQAFGPLGNEVIPNAEVQIVPGPNFSGSINYKDPTIEAVTAVTGSDGKANFLYLPDKDYGLYIPTTQAAGTLAGLAKTNVANDTLVLPTPVAVDEIYNTREGWLVGIYNVINTDPLFGLLNGKASLGQIPFTTTGVSGTITYKTNGEKVSWSNGTVPIKPIDARDVNNNSFTSGSFNGLVTRLVYNIPLATTANIGAYFVNFVQRVLLQVQLVNSDIISNTILLEMAVANPINQNPWLILDSSTQGVLNQYRLGWQEDLPNSF